MKKLMIFVFFNFVVSFCCFSQSQFFIAGKTSDSVTVVDINPDTVVYTWGDKTIEFDLDFNSTIDFQIKVLGYDNPMMSILEFISITGFNGSKVVYDKIDTTTFSLIGNIPTDTICDIYKMVKAFNYGDTIEIDTSIVSKAYILFNVNDNSTNCRGEGSSIAGNTQYINLILNHNDTLLNAWLRLTHIDGYLSIMEYGINYKQITAIDENNAKTIIKLFPNPANENLTISFDLANSKAEYEFKLINSLGTTILSKKITNKEIIDLSSVRSGVYCCVIKEGNQNIFTKKVIIQK
ncbi:MAG: T9SS type A sorting domain-containing protein [Bacteroidota bacterium]